MRCLDGITDSMEQAQGVGDGQGSLACCSPWGFPATILEWVAISFSRGIYTTMCKIAIYWEPAA